MAGYSVGKITNSRRFLNSCLSRPKLPLFIQRSLFRASLCSFGKEDSKPKFGILLNRKYYERGIYKHCCSCLCKRVLNTPSRHFFQIPGQLTSNKRKEYSNRKLIGFSMENLYTVVSEVDEYKYFVPWCRDSVVFDKKPGHMKCKLVIGFPPLVERYISVLTLVPPNLVVSECTQGELFNYMKTVWRFSPGLKGNPRTTIVDFHVAFEFRSALHSQLSSVFFDEVAKKMVGAFEKRCEEIYGPSSLSGPRKNPRTRTRANDALGASPR